MDAREERCSQAAMRIHEICGAMSNLPMTRSDLQMLLQAIDVFLALIDYRTEEKPLA